MSTSKRIIHSINYVCISPCSVLLFRCFLKSKVSVHLRCFHFKYVWIQFSWINISIMILEKQDSDLGQRQQCPQNTKGINFRTVSFQEDGGWNHHIINTLYVLQASFSDTILICLLNFPLRISHVFFVCVGIMRR